MKRHKMQSEADKKLLNGVCMIFALQKTALQQSASSYSTERKNLLVDKTTIETEFVKYRAKERRLIYQLQTSVKGNTQCANGNNSERVRFFIAEKCLKAQLRLRSDDIEELEDLKQQLDYSVAKERRTQSTVDAL